MSIAYAIQTMIIVIAAWANQTAWKTLGSTLSLDRSLGTITQLYLNATTSKWPMLSGEWHPLASTATWTIAWTAWLPCKMKQNQNKTKMPNRLCSTIRSTSLFETFQRVRPTHAGLIHSTHSWGSLSLPIPKELVHRSVNLWQET